MATFEDVERAIEELPDADFRVFIDTTKAAPNAHSDPDLAKLYAKWGFLAVEAKEEVWPRPTELEVLPQWRFQYRYEVPAPAAAAELTIDEVLARIGDLVHFLARLRKESMTADALMAEGRKVDWVGPAGADAINNLKQRPAPELAPHVKELVDTVLPGERLSIGVLDILAQAGKDAFGAVAAQVYAHPRHGEYVIELLGKLGETSPEAISKYRAAFEGGTKGELDKAFIAVKAIAEQPAARELVPVLRAGVNRWKDNQRAEAIALLAHLGEPIGPLVQAHLDGLVGGSFATLLRRLKGLDVSPLASTLLARYRALDPKDRNTLETIEALVGLGIEDRAAMEATLREHFVPRGGRWQSRAEAVLERWK